MLKGCENLSFIPGACPFKQDIKSGHTVGGRNFASGLASQVSEPKVGRLSERARTAPPSPQVQCWGLQTCDLTRCDHLFLSESTPRALRITNIVFGGRRVDLMSPWRAGSETNLLPTEWCFTCDTVSVNRLETRFSQPRCSRGTVRRSRRRSRRPFCAEIIRDLNFPHLELSVSRAVGRAAVSGVPPP